jgi:hypothetical protein
LLTYVVILVFTSICQRVESFNVIGIKFNFNMFKFHLTCSNNFNVGVGDVYCMYVFYSFTGCSLVMVTYVYVLYSFIGCEFFKRFK